MSDQHKTKAHLIEELEQARHQIATLEEGSHLKVDFIPIKKAAVHQSGVHTFGKVIIAGFIVLGFGIGTEAEEEQAQE